MSVNVRAGLIARRGAVGSVAGPANGGRYSPSMPHSLIGVYDHSSAGASSTVSSASAGSDPFGEADAATVFLRRFLPPREPRRVFFFGGAATSPSSDSDSDSVSPSPRSGMWMIGRRMTGSAAVFLRR